MCMWVESEHRTEGTVRELAQFEQPQSSFFFIRFSLFRHFIGIVRKLFRIWSVGGMRSEDEETTEDETRDGGIAKGVHRAKELHKVYIGRRNCRR